LALASFEAAFHNIKRDALFVCPGICDQLIVDVFPQLAVTLEVDLHGNLLAFVVGNELNAFHHFSSLTDSNDDRTGRLPTTNAHTSTSEDGVASSFGGFGVESKEVTDSEGFT
jgi:hypothetical protein